MSTMDKINKIAESKAAIKAAIEAKGVSDVGDKLADYPAKIASIQTGGGDDSLSEKLLSIMITAGITIDTRAIVDETIFNDNLVLIDL